MGFIVSDAAAINVVMMFTDSQLLLIQVHSTASVQVVQTDLQQSSQHFTDIIELI